MNFEPLTTKNKEKITAEKEEIKRDLIMGELQDLLSEDEEDNDDNDEGENKRDLDSERKKQNYELQFVLNKLFINHTAEDLSKMMSGQHINGRTIGRNFKIQKGFLTSTEIKTLKESGFVVEEIENDIAPVNDALNMGLVGKIRNAISRENTKEQRTQLEQQQIKQQAEQRQTEQQLEQQQIRQQQQVQQQQVEQQQVQQQQQAQQQQQVERQQAEQQQIEREHELKAIKVSLTHDLNKPAVIEPAEPNKQQKSETATPEVEKQRESPQQQKEQEQQIPNGWIDGHDFEANKNGMKASCWIHYYTEEQRRALLQEADNQLKDTLDSKTHLMKYYNEKETKNRMMELLSGMQNGT
jgi:hypothetical protein